MANNLVRRNRSRLRRRPYHPNMDINVPEIDVRFPLYPIRGSHPQYQCKVEKAGFTFHEPGKNCSRYEHQNATGFCYETTFGDWRCYQSDSNIPSHKEFSMVPPPPGEKTATNKTAANDEPVDTKNTEQPADTKKTEPIAKAEDKANTDRDENGFVKPDFSEMENYFEIVRYEYDLPGTAMYVVAKVKKSHNRNSWNSRFYDADGVKIKSSAVEPYVTGGENLKVGEVVKLKIWTPDRGEMRDKVKKFVLTRNID